MNPNNRCIFCVQASSGPYCGFANDPYMECDGLKDKQRCPFWAIADALGRIEAAVERLEVRE